MPGELRLGRQPERAAGSKPEDGGAQALGQLVPQRQHAGELRRRHREQRATRGRRAGFRHGPALGAAKDGVSPAQTES